VNVSTNTGGGTTLQTQADASLNISNPAIYYTEMGVMLTISNAATQSNEAYVRLNIKMLLHNIFRWVCG
jgi:hypothetical protein